jgi:spermidine/putrescine transport system ATP-binding protein
VADFIGETNFIDGQVAGQEGDLVEVDIPGSGVATVQSSRRFTKGQAVSLAVRPEKLRLNDGLPEANNLDATLEDLIYIGTDTHYGVILPGGQRLRVREQNVSRAQKTLAGIGEQVSVSFTRSAVRLLTE